MLSRRYALYTLAASVLGAGGGYTLHRTSAQSTPRFNTLGSPGGAAIKGYDPVAYFTAGTPTPGTSEHAVVHGGARWLFASARNKALFEDNPERYLPAYGGYCAYGVSRGYLVKIEPDAWTIRDGRLYLNYDLSVKAQWDRDPAGYIRKADKNWPALTRQA